MAESLATGLAVEAVKAVTKVVTARALKDINLAWSFQENLEKLKKRLLEIQAFLEDVGSGKHIKESKRVNQWLQQVIDVAYSADNLMDDYIYEILRRQIELKNSNRKPSFKKKCTNFLTPSTNPIVFRVRMGNRVRTILFKFDELDQEAKKIGLQQLALARGVLTHTSSYIDNAELNQARKHAAARESEFFGRYFDEEMLLKMLCNPCSKEGDLPIIAIVGIGGQGKTTLARYLYEHNEVDRHFDNKKVWICVSKTFDVERILKEMVEGLTSSKCDLANIGAIINTLQGELKGKKFLLVLDDVWSNKSEIWDSLKNELHRIGDLAGSVILITTRNVEVAEKARAIYSHELKGLSEYDGLALLKHMVFVGTTVPNISSSSSSVDDVGRRIVEKCKGVPLAIKAIGGLLQAKDLSEWRSIERNVLWDLVQPNILPSLLLSYNQLCSVYVKQCFAYCAIFPKGELMERDQLIALWLAQGFLYDDSETSNSNSTVETIGEKYFDMLVNCSFLQEVKESYPIMYKMHDLVHDLATYISKKDPRHLMIDLVLEEEKTLGNLVIQKLKTISIWGSVLRWDSLLCAQYLRTLILFNIGLSEVPSVIRQLIHLRYLDVSYNYEIDVLPESICKLYQLQTLRFFGCNLVRELPREVYRLVNLRHIQAGKNYLLASKGLQHLTSLQTLPHLVLSDGKGWTIDELEHLNQVKGKIFISRLEYVKNKEEARKANLRSKDKILELNFEWGLDREGNSSANIIDEEVLGSLEPHPWIKSLRVSGFMGMNFPSWIMAMAVKNTPLSNLTKVELMECWRCQQLPTLGQLPFLSILRLEDFHEVRCIGNEFYQNSGGIVTAPNSLQEQKVLFPALITLHIRFFWKVTSWMPPSQALAATVFPNLETLEIHDCPELEAVPASIFPSLRHLQLEDLGGTQPLDIVKHSHHLSSVRVTLMDKITEIPLELINCSNLETLDINGCKNLKSIPTGLISLEKIWVEECSSLTCIPDDVFHGLSSLRELTISNCNGLKRLPTSLGECTSLEFLHIINCPLIEGPVPNLGKLQVLDTLDFINTGELMNSSAHWISHLKHLWELYIGGFRDEGELKHFLSIPLFPNQFVKQLELWNCPTVTSLPQQLQILLPTRLQILHISGFDELEGLPEWICSLSFLNHLKLSHCKKLNCLPSKEDMLRLSGLQHLSIKSCPLLEISCIKDYGLEWVKISHIPHVKINDKYVQSIFQMKMKPPSQAFLSEI